MPQNSLPLNFLPLKRVNFHRFPHLPGECSSPPTSRGVNGKKDRPFTSSMMQPNHRSTPEHMISEIIDRSQSLESLADGEKFLDVCLLLLVVTAAFIFIKGDLFNQIISITPVRDYTFEFTTNEVFVSKESLISWTQQQGKKYKMVIVIIRSDNGGGKKIEDLVLNLVAKDTDNIENQIRIRRAPRVKAKTKGRPKKIDTSTRRMPLEWEYVLSQIDIHSSMSSMDTAGVGVQIEQSNVNPSSQSFTASMPSSQSLKTSISQSRVLSPALSSNIYLLQIPVVMKPFVLSFSDVVPDGNCGYRVVASGMGYQMQVNMSSGHPLPHVAIGWHQHAHSTARGWYECYKDRENQFKQLIGDVTNVNKDIVDII